ncbi:unnamed protein product [Adineta ricciae]|uniref:Slit-like protein n=1 Tax=Adineta ricciae TaxID=249248 RepID=A0A814GI76_ADIRI|nr:unnamed protein product [Adineta ricciae]
MTIFSLIILFFQLQFINACPSMCSCQGTIVDCSNRNLQVIPSEIPKNVFKLDLQFNNISIIRKDDFKAFRQLRVLNLQDNQIHTIDTDAFRDLTSLEKLRLNGNKVNHFADGMFNTLKQLQRLDLSSNRLRAIKTDTFQGLHELTNLQLDHNEISCIEPEAINGLKRLEIITLNSNNLTTLPTLPFAQLLNLRVLRLHDNPFICDCRLLWLAKYLRVQSFLGINTQCQDSDTSISKDIAILLNDEERCSAMDYEDIEYKCNVFICPYPCVCFNGVVDCKDKELTEIPQNIPDSTVELRLEKNRIIEIPPKAFSYLKRLRRLDLSNNLISIIYPNSFAGLQSLNSLILYRNNLKMLPSEIFNELNSLQLLLLNANKIVCIRGDTFYGLEKLSLLSLYDNQLKTLANETFSPLKNLQTLHLARNPFICDCHLRWLNAYLRNKQIETSGVRCAGPRRMIKRKFGVLNDRRFRCRNRMEYEHTAYASQCEIQCPKGCTCHKTTVICRGLQLQTIPTDLPAFTTILDLQDNLIKRISREDDLRHLKSLYTLDLRNNRLDSIDDDAFDGVDSLNELFLSNNSLHKVTSHTLNGLKSLQTLDLSNNRLRCIDQGSFDQLQTLSELNLQSNPLICNCHMKWLKYSKFLTDYPKCVLPITLNNTLIANVPDEEFICNSTDTNVCATSSFNMCPPNCTCYGKVVRCSHAQLTRIPYEEIPIDTEELYFDSNHIEEIPIESMKRLVSLTRVDFSYNRLRSISGYLFSNLTRLETLILSYNKIQCLDVNAFKGLKNLRILSLHGNEIASITEGTFNDLTVLSHVALGSNPFYCDCHLAWLSSWIKTDYVEPGIARCMGPSLMENKLLLTSPISFFQCYNKNESDHYQHKCNPCYKNSITCLNNGTCRPLSLNEHVCDCLPKYHGDSCEKIRNGCMSNPCEQQGTCQSLADGLFQCSCLPGFTGKQCEININDCISNGCQNNGTCIDRIDDYSCLCLPSYTGKFCEEELNWCSERLNPCQNSGRCLRIGTGYKCECSKNFAGINCTEIADKCSNHACQFGVCIPDDSGYTCKCDVGFTGQYCESAPELKSSKLLVPIKCTDDFCSDNGVCYEEAINILRCRCFAGYVGERCSTLQSVHLKTNNSFIKLPKPNLYPRLNITIVFSTKQSSGILVYFGHVGHLVAELFMGRIRISYDVDSSPGSVIFSYDAVNDGNIHELQLISSGSNFSLTVDRSYTRHISNRGGDTYMNTSDIRALYIGGISNEMILRALQLWHIREATSFQGCIHALYINNNPVNFADVDYRHKVLPGCETGEQSQLSCTSMSCQNGQCYLEGFAHKCRCYDGFTGPTCSENKLSSLPASQPCGVNIETGYYIDPTTKCSSIKRLRMTKCHGECSPSASNATQSACCTPVEPKRRYFRMRCTNGFTYRQSLDFFKHCKCSTTVC